MKSKYRSIWGFIFVLPQLIGLVLFSLIPIFNAISYSFTDWNGYSETRNFVGFTNYISQVGSDFFQKAFSNTFMYVFYYVPPAIISALLIAMCIQKIKGKTIYRVIFFMPVIASSVSVGVIWTWLYNGDFGLINQFLSNFGIQGPAWIADPKWVLRSIAILSVWWSLGYNMIIFLAGLQNVPTVYYEAAEIDGANKIQVFFGVTLPMISPTLLFVSVMTIISSFQVFDQAFIMTEGGPAKASYTFVYHVYQLAFKESLMGAASASAIMLFGIILVITAIQMVISKRLVTYDQ